MKRDVIGRVIVLACAQVVLTTGGAGRFVAAGVSGPATRHAAAPLNSRAAPPGGSSTGFRSSPGARRLSSSIPAGTAPGPFSDPSPAHKTSTRH
jgi:hypothetical protein